MTTLEIAKKYVELCKAHQNNVALETLFSPDIVSVEAGAPPGQSAEVRGLKDVAEKSKGWLAMHEVHSASVEGPWPNGDRFIVRFTYDVTNKPSGQRFVMDETALFTVESGKITREEFFYSMGLLALLEGMPWARSGPRHTFEAAHGSAGWGRRQRHACAGRGAAFAALVWR